MSTPIYEEGLRTGLSELRGRRLLASPYQVGTPEYDQWIAGWCASRRPSPPKPKDRPIAETSPFIL